MLGIGLGVLMGCGPRVMEDGDGSGAQTEGAATDPTTEGASATSAGSGGETEGAWMCPTTVAEPPWCYDRVALPGIERPWAGVPVDLGEGRGTGLAVFHEAGSDPIWNGGPVSLVAWEDGAMILTHGDFAHPGVSREVEDIRAVRLSGNAAEDLLVHNRVYDRDGTDNIVELLVLEEDRWVLAGAKTITLPEGFVDGGVMIARDVDGEPVLLMGEQDVGFHRLVHGADAWTLGGEILPLPTGLPEGGWASTPRYGDANGDGREDVLVRFGNGDDDRLVLLRADPREPSGFAFVDLGARVEGYMDLDFGDFNGDGRLDALAFHDNDPLRFELHYGRSDGKFDAPVSGEVPTPPEGVGRMAGDVNGDGLRDLFMTMAPDPRGLGVIEQLASGGTMGVLFVADENPLVTADVNDDGQLDIVTGWYDVMGSLLVSITP